MPQTLSNSWIQKRRPHWDRLAHLLAVSDQNGLKQLSRAELQELALLYRQVAADLSVLRQDTTARTFATYVNQLLARATVLSIPAERRIFSPCSASCGMIIRPSSSATSSSSWRRC